MTAIGHNNNYSKLNKLVGVAILYYALFFPNAIFLPIGAILATIFVFKNSFEKNLLQTDIIIVGLFCILYFNFDSYSGYSQYAKKVYGYTLFIMYLMGISVSYQGSNSREKESIKQSIDIAYYGVSFFVLACILNTYLKGYSFSSSFRTPLLLWDNSFVRSTHMGTISAIPLSISILKVNESENKKRFIHICIMILMIIANLLMSNRVLFLFLTTFLLFAIIRKMKEKSHGNLPIILVGLMGGGLPLFFLLNLIQFDLNPLLSKIPLYSRMQELHADDPRVERQLYIINNLSENIRGGGYYTEIIGDPHNVWLDIYDRAGIISALLFSFLTIILIRKIVFLLNSKEDFKLNSLCIVVIIGFLVAFSEESVNRSSPPFMVLFFFYAGLVIGYCKRCSHNRSKNLFPSGQAISDGSGLT